MKFAALVLISLFVATQDPDPHAYLLSHPLAWKMHAWYAAGQDGPPPCTAEKPWMCGNVEISCDRTGVRPDSETSREHYKCSCKHTCNKEGQPDDETQSRNWDRDCKTRCNPRHCHCTHPCGAT